jgi:hypothetical protein
MSRLDLVREVEEAKRTIERVIEKFKGSLSHPQDEKELETTLGIIDLGIFLAPKVSCSLDTSSDTEYEFEARTSLGPFEIELYSFTEKRSVKCEFSLGVQKLILELKGRELRVKKGDSVKQLKSVESWSVYEPT